MRRRRRRRCEERKVYSCGGSYELDVKTRYSNSINVHQSSVITRVCVRE
jgi:hypothetical protein